MKFETPFCNPGRLSGFYRIYGISRPDELCEDSCTMSRPTEARIHALCWDAIAATEERDVERIIAELREWFPTAKLVGWKYEADGDRPAVIRMAGSQMAECRTNACVANGPAYGRGFNLVTRRGQKHLAGMAELFAALEKALV